MMSVIFHLNELSRWQRVQQNINHLLKASKEITITILVNGPAIAGFLDNQNQAFINQDQLTFFACQNALNAHQIKPNQLPHSVVVVPSGVLKLIELQSKNYAYIKP